MALVWASIYSFGYFSIVETVKIIIAMDKKEFSKFSVKKKFKFLKICVIIPSYRNAQFLDDVLNSVLEQVDDVIVVNDGSPDDTAKILQKYHDKITIVTHQNNKGKGIAIYSGFVMASQLNFEYAVTMDSDNQHKASDLGKFADMIFDNPASIVVGSRNFEGKDIKSSSSFANKFSNFWFMVHTLQKLSDTQTGYRLYPIKKLLKIKPLTSRYEAELEFLVRSKWRGVKIVETPIDVFYPKKEERVSSFRPFKDFTRISILNTFFTFVAILYGYPSMLIRKIFSS